MNIGHQETLVLWPRFNGNNSRHEDTLIFVSLTININKEAKFNAKESPNY